MREVKKTVWAMLLACFCVSVREIHMKFWEIHWKEIKERWSSKNTYKDKDNMCKFQKNVIVTEYNVHFHLPCNTLIWTWVWLSAAVENT